MSETPQNSALIDGDRMETLTHLSLKKPPEFLFIPVNSRFVDSVLKKGIRPVSEPFVAMYGSKLDIKRNGKRIPYILVVMSGLMAEDGYMFALAESGEWVTAGIPPKYIRMG